MSSVVSDSDDVLTEVEVFDGLPTYGVIERSEPVVEEPVVEDRHVDVNNGKTVGFPAWDMDFPCFLMGFNLLE